MGIMGIFPTSYRNLKRIEMNEVKIDGVIMRDAEVKSTETYILTKFTISQTDKKNKIHYFDIDTWGEAATVCQNLKKGDSVQVEGELKYDSWTSQDGTKKSKVKILGDVVRIIAIEKPQTSTEWAKKPIAKEIDFSGGGLPF